MTLFHHLPGESLESIAAHLRAVATAQSAFPLQVDGLQSLGYGVAYKLHSPVLGALRESLALAWSDWLTPQDRQEFRPHITVQNKVSTAEAHATLALLQAGFTKQTIHATGFSLWRYDGGPWHPLETFSFP